MSNMEEEKLDLDAAIGAAYDKVMATRTVGQEPEIVEKPVEAKAEKPRKKDGKFAKPEEKQTESDAPSEAAPEEITAETSDEKGLEEQTDAEAPKVPDMPATLTAAAKKAWATSSPEMRDAVLRLDAGNAKLQSNYAQLKKQYEPLENTLAPHRNVLASTYGSVENGLQTLFALSDFAAKDPYGFVAHFAQQRGLNLGSLIQRGQPQQVDPTIAALQQEIAQLKNGFQQQTQTQQQAREQAVKQTLEEFLAEGKPYFEDVKDDMADLLDIAEKQGRKMDLQEAYDRATWARPDVRQRILEDQRRSEREQAKAEAAKKAKSAKTIAVANVATRGVSGGSPSAKRTIEETINAVANNLMN